MSTRAPRASRRAHTRLPAGHPLRPASRRLVGLVALLLGLGLGAAAPARALTTISTDTTLPGDPTYGATINDDVWLTEGATLTLNPDGSINGSVAAFDLSTVNVSGGSIAGELRCWDQSNGNISGSSFVGGTVQAAAQSTVMVSGGSIGESISFSTISAILTTNTGTINVTGGSISGNLSASESSTVNVSGGSISGHLFTSGTSTLDVSGGSIGGGLSAVTNSLVNVSGGSISGPLITHGTSTLDVSGGSIGGYQVAYEDSSATVRGGSVAGGLNAAERSTVMVSGGSIGGDLTAFSTMTITGGSISGSLIAHSGTMTIVGSCLLLSNPMRASDGSCTEYALTGVLADSTELNHSARACYGGSFVLNGTDTTPPVISALSVSPAMLWPPNHKLVEVTVSATASDNCSGVTCQIVNITSSEADSGLGPDDIANDIQQTGPLTANLRAERFNSDSGRIYTITVACTDASGLTSTGTVTVTVPHRQR